MSERFPYSEQVAANLLRRYGPDTIRQLHQSAEKAYREGNQRAARSIQDIADTAERIWRQPEDNQTGLPQQPEVGQPAAGPRSGPH